jgi:hypothetical protein
MGATAEDAADALHHVRRFSRSPEDPEARIHVAGRRSFCRLFVRNAPDLSRIGERPQIGRPLAAGDWHLSRSPR